jgi:outer membrane protein insertion porin family
MSTSRYASGKTVSALALLALACMIIPGAVSHLAAQQAATEQTPVSYEGQRVMSVEVAGQPDLSRRAVADLLSQPENAPYHQEEVDRSVEALKKTGKYTNVKALVTPEANGLRVLFVLQPAYYFGIFSFPSAVGPFSYTRLLQAANYPRQEPYTSERVDEATSNLLEFFHQTGYFQATVEPELQKDERHGVVNVLFDVKLRRRSKFGKVTIGGLSPEETARLQGKLHSIRARIRGAYLKPGKPYTSKKVQAAIKFLQAEMGKQHYLAARVQLVAAKYNPATNRADVDFHITRNEQINIRIAGARVRQGTQKKLIPMYQENSVDPDLVQEGAQNLTSYFQAKGFFDAKVESKITTADSASNIIYQVTKGRRGKVTGISFHGNQKVDEDDLEKLVTINKANRFLWFSHGKFSEKLMRKSVKNIQGFYQSRGFSQVTVVPRVVNKDGKLQAIFQIQEGPQDVVDALTVEGNHSIDVAQFAPKGLNLEAGKPYSQLLLSRDRDQIMATYLDRGYLTMSFRARVDQLKQTPHHVRVTYTIDEGPQVFAMKVEPIGEKNTRPSLIRRNANLKQGQPLSQTALLTGESQLYTLGIFDWASVNTRRPVTEQSESEVLIKVHESKRNTIKYGFGFEATKRGGNVPGGTVAVPGLPPVGVPTNFKTSEQTFVGPRGSIEYERRNFRGRAETITTGLFAGRLDQRASSSWTDPYFRNSSWTATLNTSIERSSQNPIFTSRQGSGGIQFQRYLDAKKTKSVFFRYNFSRTNLSNILLPDLVLPQDRNVRLSTFSASFIRDTRDDVLDAHRGLYESFEANINPSALGSNTNFGRFLGQTAYYKPVFTKDIIWANSIRLGLEQAFSGAHIPLSETFFSGGGSTIRGFPLNGAGPQRAVQVCGVPGDQSTCAQISVPFGGPQLFILNSELRFPTHILDKLGAVVFYDGGNVFRSLGLGDIGNYSNTLGFGFRYATPVGPVRVDIGRNLNPLTGISATQFFITLGQAF